MTCVVIGGNTYFLVRHLGVSISGGELSVVRDREGHEYLLVMYPDHVEAQRELTLVRENPSNEWMPNLVASEGIYALFEYQECAPLSTLQLNLQKEKDVVYLAKILRQVLTFLMFLNEHGLAVGWITPYALLLTDDEKLVVRPGMYPVGEGSIVTNSGYYHMRYAGANIATHVSDVKAALMTALMLFPQSIRDIGPFPEHHDILMSKIESHLRMHDSKKEAFLDIFRGMHEGLNASQVLEKVAAFESQVQSRSQREFRTSFGGAFASIHLILVVSSEDDRLGKQVSLFLEFHKEGLIQQIWVPLELGKDLVSQDVLTQVCTLERWHPFVGEWERKVWSTLSDFSNLHSLGVAYEGLGQKLNHLLVFQDEYSPYWEVYAKEVEMVEAGISQVEECVRQELYG